MSIREVLLLGNPRLHELSRPVTREDLPSLTPIIQDLRDTLLDFRTRTGAGRAIAAPQIGLMKRLIVMETEGSHVLINPELTPLGDEMMELWDDCLSFPDLLVRVRRFRRCRVRYRDPAWNLREIDAGGDLSELLQHECDHLEIGRASCRERV